MFFWLFVGCIQNLTQVAGTGATYTTRCSSQLDVVDGEHYRARCTPPPCTATYTSGPISHVVVALDPGRKLVGYAERICVQDLAEASGLFNPALTDGNAEETSSTERPPPSSPEDGSAQK